MSGDLPAVRPAGCRSKPWKIAPSRRPISDPVGDFLPTYTGPQDPGLDVVAHEVVLLEDQGRVVFSGQMAGPIAATQAIGGLYLIGVDRGQGTPRFLGRHAARIGPNVLWDSVVRVNPNGTGLFNNHRRRRDRRR